MCLGSISTASFADHVHCFEIVPNTGRSCLSFASSYYVHSNWTLTYIITKSAFCIAVDSYKILFGSSGNVLYRNTTHPISTQLGFKHLTVRSWQYILCPWDACPNHATIFDFKKPSYWVEKCNIVTKIVIYDMLNINACGITQMVECLAMRAYKDNIQS